MKVVVQPLPRLDLGNAQTGGAIGKWREEEEAPNQDCNDNARGCPSGEQRLASNALSDRPVAGSLGDNLASILVEASDVSRLEVEDELDQSSCDKGASKVCWQVVVQEELTAHDEEWNIVGGPGQEEEASAVVQTRAGA